MWQGYSGVVHKRDEELFICRQDFIKEAGMGMCETGDDITDISSQGVYLYLDNNTLVVFPTLGFVGKLTEEPEFFPGLWKLRTP